MSTLPRAYGFLAFSAQPMGDSNYYAQLARKASQISSWEAIPVLAEQHALGPLLHSHLQAAQVALPISVRRQLQGLYLRHRHANQVRTGVLCDILTAYREAGIQVLLLKGAALAQLSYPQPGLRPMRDIDLLVRKADAWQAQKLLAELGFRAPVASTGKMPSKHLAAATRQTEGLLVSVEVHHNLFHDDYRISKTLEQLTGSPVSFSLAQGITADTLGYEDMLWHLCHHIVNIAHPFRLIWLADIVGFAEHFVWEIDWQRIRQDYGRILNILSLFNAMTPLSDSLRQQARIHAGTAPRQIGLEFRGWPRVSLVQKQANIGYIRFLHDTFFPSDWWLSLYYGVGARPLLFWYRWVRHPLHILGFAARHFRNSVLARVRKSEHN